MKRLIRISCYNPTPSESNKTKGCVTFVSSKRQCHDLFLNLILLVDILTFIIVIWILSWMVVLRSCFVLQLFCYCLDGWVIWMLSWMVVLSPCVVLNYFAIVLTDESYEFWLGDAMTLSPVLGLFCCYLDFHKHSFLHRERPNLLLQQTLSYWILRSADETRNYLEN
jgi:hypothetical protein